MEPTTGLTRQPGGIGKNGRFEPKTLSSPNCSFCKLFFGSDLFEGPDIRARILSRLKLSGLLAQGGNRFMEKSDCLGGRTQGCWHGGFSGEGGPEGWLFHDWDNANHHQR